MATQEKKSAKGWPKIGSLRKNDKGSYIVLDSDVELFKNGVKVDMNDKRTVRLQDPRETVQFLEEKGYITEAEADKRRENLADKDWLRYELVVPPPRVETK